MLILRPTQSLAGRMGIKHFPNQAKSTGRLGDWYAQDIVIAQKQLILCVSENGKLPLVMKAAPYAEFPERLAAEVVRVLSAIGIPQSLVRAEIEEMFQFSFGKTESRSTLGVMKQFREGLEHHLYRVGLNQDELLPLSLWLTNYGTTTLPEFWPAEAVCKIFDPQFNPRLRIIQ